MNRPAPDAEVRRRRRSSLAVASILTAMMTTASCATSLSAGQAMTTTTLVTTATSIAASSGPGVQPSFETGVPDAVISFTDSLPTGAHADDDRRDEVRRGLDGDLLVITWGSTTCPRMPVVVSALDLVTIDVVTGSVRVDPARAAEYVPETALCTGDLGPTVSTIRLPEGAAGTGPLTVIVDGVPHQVD